MDWVNLLQDGAIICLAVVQIADSFSIRGLRKQVDGLRKSKQDKDHDLTLIESYCKFDDGRVRNLYCDQALEDAASRETRAASGFKPCLFRKGDSVQLSGLQGEFILISYSRSGFSAVKKASLFDMNEGSSVGVSTTVIFHADRVTAWKRNTGEWPVEWFMGTGSKCEEGGSDDHGRRVKEPGKKNAAGSSCGSDKRK